MARPRKHAGQTQENLLAPAEIPVEEQPFELPRGWKWIRLGSAISLHRGVSYKKSDAHSVPSANDCLIMRGGNICEGTINLDTDNIYVDKSLISQDQFIKYLDIIIVSSTGSKKVIGRAGISFQDYSNVAFGAFLTLARINNGYNKRYISFYFQSDLYRNRIRKLATGVNINNVKSEYITESELPLPPLDEQQRIVDRIESLFAKLDEAKAKAEAVLDGFEIRKAAILHKAFTGELTHAIPSNFLPITNFISKEKNSIKAGPFGSALKKDFYVSSGYKIYGQEQVISGDENFGDYFINEEKYQELKSCKVTPGDVLISLVGTVGKILILSDKCKPGIINPRLIKVTFDKKKMTQKFFKYYFQSDEVKASYRERSHGTTMDVMNMSILKQLNFPCFTITEQQEIVSILDNLLAKEQQAKEAAETVLNHIDLMKKAILAKAFRGELGTHIAD